MEAEDDPRSGERKVLALLDGFIQSKVLMTAFGLDLFSLVADRPLSPGEILERLALPRRAGTILLNACLALDLLEQDGDGCLHTRPDVRKFLVRDESLGFRLPTYLIEYYENVYPHLVEMEKLVRTDGGSSRFSLRPYFKEDVSTIDPKGANEYSRYMASTMPAIAEVVLETVSFAKSRFLLDLCGSTGAFCRAILRQYPALRAAFLDVPAVVEIGQQELAADAELADRLTPIPGDMFKTPLPKGLDTVTMCRSAHDWGEGEMARVFARIFDALEPGGRFLLIERMLPEAYSAEAKHLYLRSVYFLLKSAQNEYRAPSTYRKMLAEQGFAQIEVRVPPRAPDEFFKGLHILLAHKPARKAAAS